MTDFVTPAWFGFKDSSGPLDFKTHATAPFGILTGGYAQKFDGHVPQNVWRTRCSGDGGSARKATSD